MKRNSYYCFVNEKKLTESEWNKQHAYEVENDFCDEWGYWHCETYALYSKAFDECMVMQIRNRDSLREWYIHLMKTDFNDEWVRSIGDFNESFKSCYGRSPWFYKDMLLAKGKTHKDVMDVWHKWDEERNLAKKEA